MNYIQESVINKRIKNLIDIEKMFGSIRKEFNTDNSTFINKCFGEKAKKTIINKAARYIKNMNESIFKEFNIDINLRIIPAKYNNMMTTYRVLNVYNVDPSNLDEVLDVSKDGRIRMVNPNLIKAKIEMTSEIVFNKSLTPKQLTAILLHEIGHIFSIPMIKIAYYLSMIDDTENNKIHNMTDTKKTIENLNYLKHNYVNIYSTYKSMGSLDDDNDMNERFADSFSSHYGYGNELVDSLLVISSNTYDMPDNRKLDRVDQLIRDAKDIMYDLFLRNRSYPELFDRLLYINDEMKYELEYDATLPKDTRAKFKNKINKLNKKLEKEYYINSDNDSLYRTYINNSRKNKLKNMHSNTPELMVLYHTIGKK